MGVDRAFGAELRRLRERAWVPQTDGTKARLTQDRLAGLSGVSQVYIANLEAGYVTRKQRGQSVRVPVNPKRPLVVAVVQAIAAQPPGLTAGEWNQVFRLAGHEPPTPPVALRPRAGTDPDRPLARFTVEEISNLTAADLERILEEFRESASTEHGADFRYREEDGTIPNKPGRSPGTDLHPVEDDGGGGGSPGDRP